MKRSRVLVGATLVVFVILLLWALLARNGERPLQTSTGEREPPKPTQTATPLSGLIPPESKSQLEKRAQAVKMVQSMLNAPIEFYGRAVDQFGNPVAGANVKYGAVDKFMSSGSDYTGVTDEAGNFSITGIKGAYMTVGVWKEGYDDIKGQSFGSFAYGKGRDQQVDRPTPSKDDPAVFILRKKAEAEPLFRVSSRQFKVPPNGAPYDIDLKAGKPAQTGAGDLRVERWADLESKDESGRFDWKCRISVPGGGLQKRNPEMDFTAPENGYRESVEIDMPKAIGETWRSTVEFEYFVKLKDSSFARLALRMTAGHTNFLVLESYLNPQIGSRNLEYDKKKQVAVQRK